MTAERARCEDAGVVVVDVAITVRDRGPEPAWHEDRLFFGPWQRYEAAVTAGPVVRELGDSPWDAVYRLVACHRPVLERSWSAAAVTR